MAKGNGRKFGRGRGRPTVSNEETRESQAREILRMVNVPEKAINSQKAQVIPAAVVTPTLAAVKFAAVKPVVANPAVVDPAVVDSAVVTPENVPDPELDDEWCLQRLEERLDREGGADLLNAETFGDDMMSPEWSYEDAMKANKQIAKKEKRMMKMMKKQGRGGWAATGYGGDWSSKPMLQQQRPLAQQPQVHQQQFVQPQPWQTSLPSTDDPIAAGRKAWRASLKETESEKVAVQETVQKSHQTQQTQQTCQPYQPYYPYQPYQCYQAQHVFQAHAQEAFQALQALQTHYQNHYQGQYQNYNQHQSRHQSRHQNQNQCQSQSQSQHQHQGGRQTYQKGNYQAFGRGAAEKSRNLEGAAKAEVEQAILEALQIMPMFTPSDFDGQVHQHLHAIRTKMGIAGVIEGLEVVRGASLRKERGTIRRGPAYISAILKKFRLGTWNPDQEAKVAAAQDAISAGSTTDSTCHSRRASDAGSEYEGVALD